MPPGRQGKSIANVTTFGPRDPRYPHCRHGDPGPGTPSPPSAPFLCSRRAPLPGFAPGECRPRPWTLNCFRASNFLSCAFITWSACALHSSSCAFVKSCPKLATCADNAGPPTSRTNDAPRPFRDCASISPPFRNAAFGRAPSLLPFPQQRPSEEPPRGISCRTIGWE